MVHLSHRDVRFAIWKYNKIQYPSLFISSLLPHSIVKWQSCCLNLVTWLFRQWNDDYISLHIWDVGNSSVSWFEEVGKNCRQKPYCINLTLIYPRLSHPWTCLSLSTLLWVSLWEAYLWFNSFHPHNKPVEMVSLTLGHPVRFTSWAKVCTNASCVPRQKSNHSTTQFASSWVLP